jgi:hypothetical protein
VAPLNFSTALPGGSTARTAAAAHAASTKTSPAFTFRTGDGDKVPAATELIRRFVTCIPLSNRTDNSNGTTSNGQSIRRDCSPISPRQRADPGRNAGDWPLLDLTEPGTPSAGFAYVPARNPVVFPTVFDNRVVAETISPKS